MANIEIYLSIIDTLMMEIPFYFQYGMDRKRCNDILSAEADRAVARRFSLQGKMVYEIFKEVGKYFLKYCTCN